VGHDIVTAALLLLGGNRELVILDGGMCLHLLDSLVGDGQAEL
jgi:type IV secretory pathway TrbD component